LGWQTQAPSSQTSWAPPQVPQLPPQPSGPHSLPTQAGVQFAAADVLAPPEGDAAGQLIIIGEGASGGALGIGVGDRVLMLENTWYSVISPEGCAAILYHDSSNAPQAAEAMRVTSQDLSELGLIDKIIKEPSGGAHSDHEQAAAILKETIKEELAALADLSAEELVRRRIEKFSKMGVWLE